MAEPKMPEPEVPGLEKFGLDEPRGPVAFAAAGCLAFLWPALTSFGIDSATRGRVEELAAKLAPIPRLALELRLSDLRPGEAQPPVDLHQMVLPEVDDLRALQCHLELAQADGRALYPPALARLAQEWAQASLGPHSAAHGEISTARRSAYDAIRHLYLEWDVASELQHTPAVFLPIDRKGAGPSPDDRSSMLEILSDFAGHDPPGPLSATPKSLWDAATDGVSVSHMGVMSGRGEMLRVNYRRVAVGGLERLLRDLGWEGDIARAAALFDALLSLVDTVTVAINVKNGRVLDDVGFEIFFDQAPEWEPRWRGLFEYLRSLGLCSSERQADLLAVSASLHPWDRAQPWPAAWIVAVETMRPLDASAVSWFERALSHIKINVGAHGELTAKAYISGQHLWSTAEHISAAQKPKRESAGSRQEAIDRAANFLLGARRQSGWWTEFRTRKGPSDEWTTAFAAWALALTGKPQAPQPLAFSSAQEAVQLLLTRERDGGGWGYNAASPPDADTTAWVLRLFQQTGYEGPARDRALGFLDAHVTAGGGLSTYRGGAPVQFPGAPEIADARGWQTGHLCVAANAASFIENGLGRGLHEHLRASQSLDGSWCPYWWRTPALATALAVEALASTGESADAIARAVAWAREYSPPRPSTFVSAWLIRILAYGSPEDRACAQERATALLPMQLEDGSWPPDADLKIPEPHHLDSGQAPAMDYEYRGVFTTAAVLAALAALEGGVSSGVRGSDD